jgi:hypothetical protein
MPVSTSTQWKTTAPTSVTGCDEAHERHRHDLDRDAGFDAVEQVLAGIFAEAESCRSP